MRPSRNTGRPARVVRGALRKATVDRCEGVPERAAEQQRLGRFGYLAVWRRWHRADVVNKRRRVLWHRLEVWVDGPQRLRELGDIVIPIFFPVFGGPNQHLFERLADTFHHGLVAIRSEQIHRHAIGEERVERRCDGIHIRPLVDILRIGALLGGHVAPGAHHRARLRHALVGIAHPRDAEVGDTADGIPRDQNVVRLDVPMNHALRMRRCNPLADVQRHVRCKTLRHRTVLLEPVDQRPSLDVLHDDEGERTLGSDIVDPHDVAVLEQRHRLRFRLEARLELRLVRELGREDLESPPYLQTLVERSVHRGHAAFAQRARQQVPSICN